jgi:sporulation protein YlmC with PRC-barrel domain
MKNKGVKMSLNQHITNLSYKDIVENGGKIEGKNVTLQMKNGQMSRLTVNKTALTGKNNKGWVCENGCVLPFVHGAKYKN